MRFLNRLCFCIMVSLFLFSCKENREFLPLLHEAQTVNNVTLDLNITTFSKQRSLQITNPKGEDRAKIQWNKGDKHKIHFALFCKEHPNWTSYGQLEGEVVKSKNANLAYNKDELKIKGNISLANGASFSQGTWYIQILLGPDDSFWEVSNATLKMKYQFCDVENPSNLNIPVASKWTKLSIKDNTAFANIHCYPIGCLFSCNVKSPLYDSIHIYRITLQNSVISTSGTFQFSVPTNSNEPTGMPKWKSLNETTSIILKSCNIKSYVESGNKQVRSSKKIYFWGMPGTSKTLSARIFGSRDPGDHGMLTKEISMGKTFENGYSYHINFELPKSDLMITEFFHLNPGGRNYSMIELYNPTVQPLDLTQYSLVRERFIGPRKETFSVGVNNVYPNVVSGFQPADYLNIIQEAVRQDLYIDNDGVPVRRVDGISVKDRRHPVWGGYESSDWWYYLGAKGESGEKWYNRSKNRFGLLWESNYKKMLDPGKCIIVCATGTLGALQTGDNENLPDKKVGNYIREAVKSGLCQYIIAVDNGTHEPNELGNYQWGDSGVMDHGTKHVMVLMKGQRPIDVTGPFAYIDGIHYFQDSWTSGNHRDNGENRGTGWIYDGNTEHLHYLPDGDPQKTNSIYNNYLKFIPQTKLLRTEDHFNLVRKPFAKYPSIEWDNNTEPNIWNKTSEWILISQSRCGGSYLSSWGTRTPRKEWIDINFLNQDLSGKGKPFYVVWPKEYDDGRGSSWDLINIENPQGPIEIIPFE